MKTKLLKKIRKRVYIQYHTEIEKYRFIDSKMVECSGGISRYEYTSKWTDNLTYIKTEYRGYILKNMHTIYNEVKPFWKISRHPKNKIIKLL